MVRPGFIQAVLLNRAKVLLTTYPHNRSVPLDIQPSAYVVMGTMWDYSVACKAQIWAAKAQCEDISDVHDSITTMPIKKWIGTQYRVDRPQKAHKCSMANHDAFIPTQSNQVLTGVPPPLWVWGDAQKLAGAWCHIATTYVDYWEASNLDTTKICTGLVLISTLGCSYETG